MSTRITNGRTNRIGFRGEREGGDILKKTIGIALVLLLACSVMASATATNWILVVTATNTAGGQRGASTNAGTQNTYTDGKDTTKGEPGVAPAPPIGGSLAYSESMFADLSLGQLDFRAPITLGTEVKTWTMKIFDLRTADAQGVLPALVNPVTVKVVESTTAGQSLVYSFNGVPYVYVVTAPGGTSWTFDAAHPWSTTNYVQFNLEGVPEGAANALNMTIVAAPIPEPGSLLALGSGLVGLVGFAIRRRRS